MDNTIKTTMKIIYIYDAIARIGGTEKILVDKMNLLADDYKQEVYLITTSQGNHPISFPLSKNVKHIDLAVRLHTIYQYPLLKRQWIKIKMNKELCSKLDDVVNEINPDIIISTSYYAADIICKIRHSAVKIVESHSVRGYDESHNSKTLSLFKKYETKRYYKTIEKYADAIITLTTGDAKQWQSNNVTTIPNSVDIHPTTQSLLNSNTALFIGRISRIKGLDRMLKAWKIAINKHQDWILKIVGDGEEKETLKQLTKNLGIEKNVIFSPSTKNVANEYINSSIFLLTSISEGLSLVVIEAMQCGIPCISFNCPFGPADIIDNDINGFLVENGNIEKFADAITTLIENKGKRICMGKEAHLKSEVYLPQNIMPRWIDLFNKLRNSKKKNYIY